MQSDQPWKYMAALHHYLERYDDDSGCMALPELQRMVNPHTGLSSLPHESSPLPYQHISSPFPSRSTSNVPFPTEFPVLPGITSILWLTLSRHSLHWVVIICSCAFYKTMNFSERRTVVAPFSLAQKTWPGLHVSVCTLSPQASSANGLGITVKKEHWPDEYKNLLTVNCLVFYHFGKPICKTTKHLTNLTLYL